MLKQNIDKVKEQVKYLARYKRVFKLQELDKQFMIAQEKGEDTSAIVAEKQKLRDLPEAIDKMRRALDEFVIEGITTTIPLHKKLLNHKKFIDSDFNVSWLDKEKII